MAAPPSCDYLVHASVKPSTWVMQLEIHPQHQGKSSFLDPRVELEQVLSLYMNGLCTVSGFQEDTVKTQASFNMASSVPDPHWSTKG